MITISDAIKSLNKNFEFAIYNNDIKNIEWLKYDKIPTEEEIQNEILRLEQEYQSKEYQRLRAAEYPSIQEQLDMQYWDGINGTTVWQNTIQAIKNKYPKPEVIN